MMDWDNITQPGARAPGVERQWLLAWRCSSAQLPPAQNGDERFASGEHEGWMSTVRRTTWTSRRQAHLKGQP